MNEEPIFSVMFYVGTVGKELMAADKTAADSSAAKAIANVKMIVLSWPADAFQF